MEATVRSDRLFAGRGRDGITLGVLMDYWSRGIASRLLQEVLAWAATVGAVRVELTVHTTNVRAVSLYLRHGFQAEGTRRSSLFVGGCYVDEYLMSKLIPYDKNAA